MSCKLGELKPYGVPGRGSGIVAYEDGEDFIRVQFKDDGIYVYNAERPGALYVERMKQLARAGQGLTTFISKRVRDNYARKE